MVREREDLVRLPHIDQQHFPGEPELLHRVGLLRRQFQELYQSQPETVVHSPGRAEIIGNHTDYNEGLVIACTISRSTLALFRLRRDCQIRIFSNGFSSKPVIFPIDGPGRDNNEMWTNYPRAVAEQLLKAGYQLNGADILIGSNVPFTGGVSSSASLEMAIAQGLLTANSQYYDPLEIALLCQRAENSIGSPCGLLDQTTVAFGGLLLLDFLPNQHLPVVFQRLETDSFRQGQAAFTIFVDPTVKRELGESGYPARRKMCEDSLPIWETLLNKGVPSLRHVSANEFYQHQAALIKRGGETMALRVEHVIMEIERVLNAQLALYRGNIIRFGQLLTASGKSALDLYQLDENTPELRFLVETARDIPGVIGVRNMGGGFSAVGLALVQEAHLETFEANLNTAYQVQFGNPLEFVDFAIAGGVETFCLD